MDTSTSEEYSKQSPFKLSRKPSTSPISVGVGEGFFDDTLTREPLRVDGSTSLARTWRDMGGTPDRRLEVCTGWWLEVPDVTGEFTGEGGRTKVMLEGRVPELSMYR